MKKYICIILCAAMVFSIAGLSLSAEENSEHVIGDVNGDGVFDVEDLLMVKKYVLKVGELTEEQLDTADVNYDGTVDVEDLLIMKKVILKVGEFPMKPTESTTELATEQTIPTTETTTQETTETTGQPTESTTKPTAPPDVVIPDGYEFVKSFDDIINFILGKSEQGYPYSTQSIRIFEPNELYGIDAIQFNFNCSSSYPEVYSYLQIVSADKKPAIAWSPDQFPPKRPDSDVFWFKKFGILGSEILLIDLSNFEDNKNNIMIEGFSSYFRYITITEFIGLKKI